MKKTLFAAALMACCLGASAAHAEGVTVERFMHQNVPGSQTCYDQPEDVAETEVTAELPDVYFGMRLNNPVIRAYLKADTPVTSEITAEQYSKFGKLLASETRSVEIGAEETAFEFDRVRNSVSVKLYADGEYIGGINDEIEYENGLHFTAAPSDHQIYQRGADDTAVVTIAGTVEAEADPDVIIGEDSISVKGDEADNGSVIIAARYDDNGTLIGVEMKEADGSETEFTSDTPYGNVKVMVWDGLENMESKKPAVSSSVTVTAENKATGEVTRKLASTIGGFNAELTLGTGLYDITVTGSGDPVTFTDVGVGDIWVAAGQSNMTDMGAPADGFDPETDDPIIDGMHIIYPEDNTWQDMAHPAGEGRFFKTGVRTSPVTSFAREITEETGVPIGIVQSSVGGTNIYQWAHGVAPGNDLDGYLIDAMKSCFDNMPSTDVKGIIWYQGCNDTMDETYAYSYEELEGEIFGQLREFFGEDTPIITTQINDAKQDDNSSLGYYDAWSYVKDVQRRNPELFENVYVVGTGAYDLGDTIHNSAASNLKVGDSWARAALNRVYGMEGVDYLHPTVDTVKVKDAHTVEVTFKDAGDQGLYVRDDIKRLGITNGLYNIQLGDLKEEFTVRMGGAEDLTSSNTNKGTTLTITDAVLEDDGKTVTITVEEELAGRVAVDCCYGKYFVPSLTDKENGWSVLSFYNVTAEWEGDAPVVSEAETYKATDTALISEGEITAEGFSNTLAENIPADTASAEYMYLNTYDNGDAYPYVKFDLSELDTTRVESAKLRIYTHEINKDRNGDITIYASGTNWSGESTYSDLAAISAENKPIVTYEGVNTSAVFPAGHYSDIDVTEYIRSLNDPGETAFSASATQVAVALMAGVDSDHAPEIVVQPGKLVTITYTDGSAPVSGTKVTISGTGQTEYSAHDFVTDENGKISAILKEGTYKAVTETGDYAASENRFTVEADTEETYSLTKNEREADSIVIEGGQTEAAAGTSTSAFTATLYDTEGIEIESGITWDWSCDNGAAVENGVVTIPDTLEAGDTVTLTVKAVYNGKEVTATASIAVIDITGYAFSGPYTEIKSFTTSNVTDIAVESSGLILSTSGSNYSGASIRNSDSPDSGYWPYTTDFQAENDAYYLFLGAGGNNDTTVITLKLAQPISAGKEIAIRLAKPKATQKAGTDRTSGNSALIVRIGSETIDLQNDFEFDEWQTVNVTSTTDVSEITFELGAWSAAAVEYITIDGAEPPVVTPDPGEEVEKIKIMPLGDSITDGYTTAGGYRNTLCNLLATNELSKYVDFVGSRSGGSGFDTDHEGHPGWAIDTIPASGDVEGKGRQGLLPNIDTWMDTYTPEIVMLQIGTNDILSQYELDAAPDRLEQLVDRVLEKLPEGGKLYLATIPYIDAGSSLNNTGKTQEELDAQINSYNTAVKAIAETNELTLVDVNSCLELTDLRDGVHPSPDGYAKMGGLWYSTLEDELESRIAE